MNRWQTGLVAAFALLAIHPGAQAAECAEEVAATTDLMQDGHKGKPEGKSEVKEGTQSSEIKESWQGGSPTHGGASGDGKVAFNPEAATFLKKASRLAEEGKSGGCRQILVQAQRILGIIPADTPLPPTQTQ